MGLSSLPRSPLCLAVLNGNEDTKSNATCWNSQFNICARKKFLFNFVGRERTKHLQVWEFGMQVV